jgi:Rieske Fe-S protein
LARQAHLRQNRTEEEIKAAQDANVASLPDPQPDTARVKAGHPNILVVYGNCTHLGCVPARQRGSVQGLVLPLPRLGLRHLRPRPRRAGADQPSDPALYLRV